MKSEITGKKLLKVIVYEVYRHTKYCKWCVKNQDKVETVGREKYVIIYVNYLKNRITLQNYIDSILNKML